jgi:cytoskeletal protein CcmA (bactofilin family)
MSSDDSQGAAGGVPSIVSSDLKIVGDMKSDGEIQIDGTVKGDIKAHMLTVGKQGKIDGSTVAETVRIFGTVNGRVQAKTVHLDKSAKVRADITHKTLTIEAGAYFEGKMQSLKGASSTGAAKL